MYGNQNRVAVHSASRIASSPYRRDFKRGNLYAQKSLKETIVKVIKRIVSCFAPILRLSKREVRRNIKTSSSGAKNKDDPHLDKRAA